MRAYLTERDRMEKLIADEYADLSKRIEAAAILLQHALSDGLRRDIRRMYLEWTHQQAVRS